MQALAGKQTLFLLQEMLSEAASKGADETPLADTLRARIEAAEQWEQRAATFLTDAETKKQQLDTLDVSAAPFSLRLTPRGSLPLAKGVLFPGHHSLLVHEARPDYGMVLPLSTALFMLQ